MRYLTKTGFKTALTCPRKLAYLNDDRYAQSGRADPLMQALAEGGHQVGALAKCRFPAGIEIDARGHAAQLEQTRELLTRRNVTLFEAAISVGTLFIRVDILRKQGKRLDLFEVKAKSFDSASARTHDPFVDRKGHLTSEFEDYVHDVAFQRHVLRAAHPDSVIRSYLLLPDKAKRSTEARIAQRLRVEQSGRSVTVIIDESLRYGIVASELLTEVHVDRYCDIVDASTVDAGAYRYRFPKAIEAFDRQLASRRFVKARPGSHCKACEFVASVADVTTGLRDGRAECWSKALGVDAGVLDSGSVLDLYGQFDVDAAIRDGRVEMCTLNRADMKITGRPRETIDDAYRRWLQCQEARGERTGPYVMRRALGAKLAALKFPLHFIDFETAAPALPYHRGRRPYETVFFQFSHHRLDADGSLSHHTQYLHRDATFPNFESVRRLARAVGTRGSVLHWWTHERTVLKTVQEQLRASREPDRIELIRFIDRMVKKRLVDLGQHHYRANVFLPGTKGGCSIKTILPAMLGYCRTVRARYSRPIYGANQGIPSHNFRDHTWVRVDSSGAVLDPYQLLQGSGANVIDVDAVNAAAPQVANGGAAMVAYALLQSATLDAKATDELQAQLLRYCELDTLAMVMIYEGLLSLSGQCTSRRTPRDLA